jgi:hypothetical protein
MVIFELTEVKKKEPKKAKKKTAHEHTEGEHAHEAHEGKPVDEKKPKKFLGGIKGIFKKERDAL